MEQIKGLESPTYFKKFVKLNLEGADLYNLAGDSLIIEKLEPSAVTTAGGIIIAHDENQRLGTSKETSNIMGIVLLKGVDAPEAIQPGCLVQIPEFSAQTYNQFPGLNDLALQKILRVSGSEVKLFWEGPEQFNKFYDLLNSDA